MIYHLDGKINVKWYERVASEGKALFGNTWLTESASATTESWCTLNPPHAAFLSILSGRDWSSDWWRCRIHLRYIRKASSTLTSFPTKLRISSAVSLVRIDGQFDIMSLKVDFKNAAGNVTHARGTAQSVRTRHLIIQNSTGLIIWRNRSGVCTLWGTFQSWETMPKSRATLRI